MAESALVCLVPAAEPLVERWRERYDPSAAAGVPAHVTLLYPFLPADAIDAGVRLELQDCFAGSSSFDFALRVAARVEGMLYLAPAPAAPFRDLTVAIWQRFGLPPYGGEYDQIMPHLTVARGLGPAELDDVATRFAPAADAMLPIHARATEVVLIDDRSGRWSVVARFGLGASADRAERRP